MLKSKIKISEKALVDGFGKENIYFVPYCGAQSMLNRESPIFYNFGIYGWNFDGYIIADCLILTGYRTTRNFQKLVGLEYIEQAYQFIHLSKDLLNVCPWYELTKEDLQLLAENVVKWNQRAARGIVPNDKRDLKYLLTDNFESISEKRGLYFDRAGYERYFIGEEKMVK